VRARQADDSWLQTDVVTRQSAVRPTKLAVAELNTGRHITYRELEDEIARCEGYLRATTTPGARVALLARNSIHHLVLFYACPRAGRIFVPLNWRLAGPELAALLEDSSPEMLVYDAEFEPEGERALLQHPVSILVRIGAPYGDEFADHLARTPPSPPGPIRSDVPCMLLYTSGTTGRPKGVIVTPRTTFFSAMNFIFVGELSAGHVQLCDVPLFHVIGLLAMAHATLLAGATLQLSDRFTPAVSLARLLDPALAVTHYFCVPQMAQALVDEPGFEGANLTGLKFFTGGAPMPSPLTLRLAERGVLAANGYGMSENGTVLGMPLDAATACRKVGSAGLPGPAVEIRLVGPDLQDVERGDVGEIWLRGPTLTPGYWNQPELTAKSFHDGWFRSGDAARCDEDGFYFIVDRWKDMYISGGENVYPAEIEAVIGDLQAVVEVAVVGVSDARWGEVGCAYVVVRQGAPTDAAQVSVWCQGRLARYKQPAHIRFIGNLPRTASGKVRKDRLREAFRAESQSELQS
jgi:fatty-acyl-CoA synthase